MSDPTPANVFPFDRKTNGSRDPIALLLVHGMGQQIPYGVLDDGYRLLKKEAMRRGGDVFLEHESHHGRGSEPVACAELVVRLPGVERRVHLYEAYWAPLTEGRISTWETFQFLISSSLRCSWESLRRGFTRFLFDRPCPFPVRPTALMGLALAAAALAALGVFDTTFVAVVASGILAGAEPHWLSPTLRLGYIHDYTLVLAVLVATAVIGIGVPGAFAWARRIPRVRPVLFGYSLFGDWAARFGVLLVAVLGFRLFLRSLLEAAPGLNRILYPLFAALESALPPLSRAHLGALHFPELASTSRAGILMIGVSVLAISAVIRWFVRSYLGDVAIYVSSHTVNRFYAARREIKAAAAAVGEFVYGRRDARGGCYYREVVVMGHSLGSVIAYDLVNHLLCEDREPAAGREAASRTRALITYGSPLDKTAFVFRAQQNQDPRVREAMAASIQPLISDPTTRSLYWINVHSRFDWIGGPLDYYDLPERGSVRAGEKSNGNGSRVRPVLNFEDDDAITPVLAHGEHDRGTLLPELVMDAVLSRLDQNARVRRAEAGHPAYTVLADVEDQAASA